MFDLTNYPHQAVVISFVIYFLDNWEEEELHVKIDDQIVQRFKSNSKSDHNIDFCGNFTYDKNERFSIEFPHIKPFLTIELIPYSSDGKFKNISRSYGITEISMDLIIQCQMNSRRINETSCECVEGYYKKERVPCSKLGFENNFCFDCISCPAFCEKCETELNCTRCKDGLLNFEGSCKAPDGIYNIFINI